ncbi:MAG: hypothetical protein KF698_08145 [Anaerolineales bacterium]|nr:hypothetical protein [Anaerolineales bacterium]
MTAAWGRISEAIRSHRQPCLMRNQTGEIDKDCQNIATEAHHGIFSRNYRFEDWIDNEINACPSCHNCNTKRVADNYISRLAFFEEQVARFGKHKVSAWLEAAPEEIQRRPDHKSMLEMVS